MAVKTSIKINDKFTRPLQSMVDSLNMTISHFEKLNEVAENPVGSENLKYARDHLANMDLAVKELRNGLVLATADQEDFKNATDMSSKAVTEGLHSATLNQNNFNNAVKKGISNLKELITPLLFIKGAMKAINFLKDGFGTYTGFTKGMGEVIGVTQAVGREADALRYKAKQLGRDTIYTASEASQGLIALAKGGLTVSEIFVSAYDSLNLAVAGTLSMDQSANILIDTMKGFNMVASQSKEIVDTIAYTANTSTSTISQIGDAFRYSASVARTFNADISEMATLMQVMSTSMKGSRLGRALRSGLGRLAGPTKPVQDWLDTLDVSPIDKHTGQLRGIIDIVGDLGEAYERLGLSNAQQIEATKALFGEQYYVGWLDAIKKGRSELEGIVDDIRENSVDSAERLADSIINTTWGKLKIFASKVEDKWINFYERLGSGPAGEAFDGVLDTLLATMNVILGVAEITLYVLGSVFNFISDNIEWILPLLILWGSHMVYVSATTTMATIATTLLGTSINFVTTSVLILLSVLFMIVAGVFLIIGVVNKLTGRTISAVGVITGTIAGSVAFVGNIFVALMNFLYTIGATMYNFIVSFAEFFANVFNNPVESIQILFLNMARFVLDIMLSIANVMDDLFDVGWGDVVTSWIGTIEKKANDIYTENMDKLDRLDETDKPFERFNITESFKEGYKYGKDIEDSIKNNLKNMFNYTTPDEDFSDILQNEVLESLLDDVNNSIGGLGDSLDSIGGDTSRIRNSVDEKEDLKYLMDLASASVINRFTTTEVKVEMNNDNYINNEMDIDGVITKFRQGLEDIDEIVPEGV